jgi:phage portal protein BeeE
MWPFKTKVAAAQLAVKYSTLFVGMGATRWLNRSYLLLAREGFENNPVVYSCVTKLARAAASVDLQLYDRTRKGKLRKIDRHDILDLLAAPNPMASGRKFLEKLATQKLIGGNAFVLGNGADASARRPPSELWLLQPNLVKVEGPRHRMMPEYYDYSPGNQSPTRYPIDQVTGRSAVLHLKTPNPLDD